MLRKLGFIDLPPHVKPGGFDHAAVHLGSGRLFVAHTSNDSIEVIDTEEDCHVETIGGHSGVAGALVDETPGVIFTSDRAAGTVSYFTKDEPMAKTVVPVGGKPNGLAFSPKQHLLLAANVGKLDGTPGVSVSFVETVKGLCLVDIEVPGRTRWTVYDSKRDRFYVNIADPAQILVFDASSPGEPISTILVEGVGPHGLEMDSKTNQLYCACDGGALIAFDLDTHAETRRAELLGGPDVVFVNERMRHIYVAIGEPGVIQVFDTDTLILIETVPTEEGAHTIGFDAKRSKVYAFLPQSCRAVVFQDGEEETK